MKYCSFAFGRSCSFASGKTSPIWIAVAFVLACGDDGSGGTGGTGGGSGGEGTGGMPAGGASTGGMSEGGGPPETSCVQPGDMGNELGVGEYCSPLGDQCDDNLEAQLCLADVGQDQWMCTRIGCDETTDCGEGAGCLITDDGSACVPCRCDDQGVGCGVGGGGVGGAGGGGGAGGAGGG